MDELDNRWSWERGEFRRLSKSRRKGPPAKYIVKYNKKIKTMEEFSSWRTKSICFVKSAGWNRDKPHQNKFSKILHE